MKQINHQQENLQWWKSQFIPAISGIILAILVYYLVPGDENPKAPIMAGIMTLMALWWIFEVAPIPVTSVLPIFLFPLFSISDTTAVGAYYGRPIIFLFLGGFILALGLQESGIHRRIALHVVRMVGSSLSKLVLGVMIATGFLSMWISNTASVMVMLPIGLSIMEGVRKEIQDEKLVSFFGVCFMLGIAYSADIGGMATLIGTPPNLIFLEMYTQIFPEAAPIGFLEWMIMGLPLSIVFMWGGWILLTRFIYKIPRTQMFKSQMITDQLREMGPMTRDEKLSGLVFLAAAILWMTGSDIHLTENFIIRGWRYWLDLPFVSDSAVAIGISILLFLIPSEERKGETLLVWQKAKKIPWGILLLFGGGFAIAGGFEMSGLSKIIEGLFSDLPDLTPMIIVLLIAVFVTFMTELTSNSAIANLLLPILAVSAVVLEIDPKLLMIPATLSASCAFMMPVASPTQAIVFGSGYVTIKQMVRTGIWFNILGIILIMVLFFFVQTFWWSL